MRSRTTTVEQSMEAWRERLQGVAAESAPSATPSRLPVTWHREVTTMTARRDLPGESFEARSAFARAAHVQIRGGNKASISAFLNDDSKGEIPRSEWLAQRDALREHGNDLIESELRARPRAYDTGPGPLA